MLTTMGPGRPPTETPLGGATTWPSRLEVSQGGIHLDDEKTARSPRLALDARTPQEPPSRTGITHQS